MSKILFFIATLLVASIGAETPSTTTGPPSSTAAGPDSDQKPAVIYDVQNPSHDSRTAERLEDSEAKPAVISAGSPDHQTNVSTHFILKREESESQRPAVITAGVSDHQNNTSKDTHSVQKREESSEKPPAAHDVTFSTLKPTGDVSADTQSPSGSQQNTGNACIQNYEPVCGSDRKTYSNLCMLGLATQTNPAIVLAKKGEC